MEGTAIDCLVGVAGTAARSIERRVILLLVVLG